MNLSGMVDSEKQELMTTINKIGLGLDLGQMQKQSMCRLYVVWKEEKGQFDEYVNYNELFVESGDKIYLEKDSRIDAFTEILDLVSCQDHQRMMRIVSAVYEVCKESPARSYDSFNRIFSSWKSIQ